MFYQFDPIEFARVMAGLIRYDVTNLYAVLHGASFGVLFLFVYQHALPM
jgi:hypothetical protein